MKSKCYSVLRDPEAPGYENYISFYEEKLKDLLQKYILSKGKKRQELYKEIKILEDTLKEAHSQEKELPPLSLVEKWVQKLCNKQNKVYFKRVCKEDGQAMMTKDINGKMKIQKPILHTCHSPYCNDEDCYKQKYGILGSIFASYFYSRPKYLEREDPFCFHFVIGDKRQTAYKRKEIQGFRKRNISFLREVNKKLGIKMKCIGSPDLSYDPIQVGDETYQHIHWASMRPYYFTKDQLLQIYEIAKKHNVVFHKIGNKKPKNLIDYFAKRSSGLFGHKDTGYYGYKDIMTKEYYFENYHGLKKVMNFGFSRKEKHFIKHHKKDILRNVIDLQAKGKKLVRRALLSCIYSMFETYLCSKCGSEKWNLQEIKDPKEEDPPPDQEILYDIVKIGGFS